MSQTVKLKVKNGTVDAHEGMIGGDGGHFNAEPGESVKWQGNYPAGNFVVTFKAVSNELTPGWPFKEPEPPGLALIVEGDGNPKPVLTLKDSDAIWKYDVAVTGNANVTPLDPMIIVRDSGVFANALATAAVGFVAGALATVLFQAVARSLKG
jgi:hypothetical protein